MTSRPPPASPPSPRPAPPPQAEASHAPHPLPPPPTHTQDRCATQEEEEGVDAREAVVESAKRKVRRHAQVARGEAAVATAITAAAQQEDTNARVMVAMRKALLYLGVNPSQHGLVNTAIDAAAPNTGSSAYPRMMRPESPRAYSTHPISGFHVYPQGRRFSGECSLNVTIVAPSTPAPMTIDINATPNVEMDAEKQAKMLELEEAKQAKMLEIEAANAKTKAKEVTLASMKTGVEIMKDI
ncbi:hypothetical protein D1007_17443 [Hordeum vulgare]|nr:hypothetical protein D1007_17443 [Hordeum vulgare]